MTSNTEPNAAEPNATIDENQLCKWINASFEANGYFNDLPVERELLRSKPFCDAIGKLQRELRSVPDSGVTQKVQGLVDRIYLCLHSATPKQAKEEKEALQTVISKLDDVEEALSDKRVSGAYLDFGDADDLGMDIRISRLQYANKTWPKTLTPAAALDTFRSVARDRLDELSKRTVKNTSASELPRAFAHDLLTYIETLIKPQTAKTVVTEITCALFPNIQLDRSYFFRKK